MKGPKFMSRGLVSCPKCKGGCDLCGGSGQVPQGVARVFAREESRATAKMPTTRLEELRDWATEAITRPATVKRADHIRHIVFWVALALLAAFTGVFLVLIIRSLL